MGLLNWRRREAGADSSRNAEPAAVGNDPDRGGSGASSGEVFRSQALAPVPDWALLPPMQLSLPEMPDIMSKRFDQSLVSWQPPARFLGELGHSVSGAAPSGIVEGMAVLVPEAAPAPEPLGTPSGVAAGDLPLAVPPSGGSEGRRSGPQVSVRRLPFGLGQPEEPGAAGPPLEVAEAELPAVVPQPSEFADQVPDDPQGQSPEAAGQDTPTVSGESPVVPTAQQPVTSGDAPADAALPAATPAPVGTAGLVGSAPMRTGGEPLVAPLLADVGPSRLVHAATPPDMPLARLPSAPLPEGQMPPVVRRQPLGDTVAMVGDRPMTDAPGSSAPSDPTGSQPGAPAATATPAPAPASSSIVPPPASPPGTPAAPAVPSAPAVPFAPAAPAAPAGSGPADAPTASPLDGAGAGTAAGPGRDIDLTLAAPAGRVPPTSQVRRLDLADEGTAGTTADAVEPTPADIPTPPPAVPAGDTATRAPAPAGVDAPDGAPTAPLVGQTPLVTGEPPSGVPGPATPLPGREPARPGPQPEPPALARPHNSPRGGLGEPMSKLPPTASPWDVTRMSRSQQLQASRALIQQHMATSTPRPSPAAAPLPLAAPERAQGQGAPAARPTGPVLAGMELPVVPIGPLSATPAGTVPDYVPPSGDRQAPLLGSEPLHPQSQEQPEPASPPEGQRVRMAVGQRYGVDLSNVPIDRSPQGASAAAQLRARAFAADGRVVIPPSVGTLETGPGEALLAHELTHVAQQVRSGPDLPAEDSLAGRAMEAEARATQLTLSTGAAVRSSSEGSAGPPRGSLQEMLSNREGGSGPLPLVTRPAESLDADALASSIMERLSGFGGAASGSGGGMELTAQPAAPAPAPAMSGGGVQRDATDGADSSTEKKEKSDSDEPSLGQALKRPSDADLSNLSSWLYPLIKYRLKGELREDRERAGLLTDHYRRW